MPIDGTLGGLTVREVAQARAAECVRVSRAGVYEPGLGWEIEVETVGRARKGTELRPGVECYVRAKFGGVAVGFGPRGEVETERMRFVNPPMLVSDPRGPIQNRFDSDGNVRRFREDPQEALRKAIARNVERYGVIGGPIVRGTVGNTTTTVWATFDANANRDSAGGPISETFATIIAGNGTSSDSSSSSALFLFQSSAVTDQYKTLTRFFFTFDTTDVGSDTVDDATFSLFEQSTTLTQLGDDTLVPVACTPNSETAVQNSDYQDAFGGAAWATGIAFSSWANNQYNDFTLNATGEAGINGSGNTVIGVQSGWDVDESFGGTWASNSTNRAGFYMMDQTGTDNDPKLVVNHTAGAPSGWGPLLSSSRNRIVVA